MKFNHLRHGENVKVLNSKDVAVRLVNQVPGNLVFSKWPLECDELFQVRVDKTEEPALAGLKLTVMGIGITTENPSVVDIPVFLSNLKSLHLISDFTCGMIRGVTGTYTKFSEPFGHLGVGETLGLRRTIKNEIHFYRNQRLLGVADGLPGHVYGLIDLHGSVSAVTLVKARNLLTPEDILNRILAANLNPFERDLYVEQYMRHLKAEEENRERILSVKAFASTPPNYEWSSSSGDETDMSFP